MIVTGYCHADSAKLIKYPDIRDVTLKNGLRVILIEHNEQPTISWQLFVKAGEIDDPLSKQGLAEVTADLLREGTLSRTSDEIADDIAQLGARLNIAALPLHTSVQFDVLKHYSEKGFDIFADIILDPAFPSKEYKRVKKDLINSVKLDLTDNYRIAFNHGRFLLFGPEHPLGRVKTEKSLNKLSLKDVRLFYDEYFRPNNSILLVIGDFSKEEMLPLIKEKFGNWRKTKIGRRVHTNMDFQKKGVFRVVDKPEMTQAVIHLRQWAIHSGDPDYYEYKLMNYVLGSSGFSSRLTKAVRAEGGKTYAIWSSYINNFDFGVLAITTSTRNDEVFNTYELIRSELKKFIDEGISQDELDKAKTYMTGAIPLQLESPGMIANKILTGIMNGLSIDDLSKEVINYNSVTVEDVNRVIRKYLLPESLNIVIVGDVDELGPQLQKIDPYEKVDYKAQMVKKPFLFFF